MIIVLLVCLNQYISADQEWKSVGLADKKVSCIVVQNSFIAAATDQGLYSNNSGVDWYNCFDGPIHDIKLAGGTGFVVAASSGLTTDGILSAYFTTMPPFIIVKTIDTLSNAQSVAVTKKGVFGDTLYAGGRNRICRSIRENDEYGLLQHLTVPDDYFGTVTPLCAAMNVWSDNNRLFAGGYDQGADPGIGHLLWQQKDSMQILKFLKITAIAENETSSGINTNIYFGTRDSGIYYTNASSSKPPEFSVQSPDKEPVNDLIIGNGSSATEEKLYAAVKSGVYSSSMKGGWTKTGNIPAIPLCLYLLKRKSGENDSLLYAGTEKGIYTFDLSATSIKYKQHDLLNGQKILRRGYDNRVSIEYTLQNSGNVRLDIFNSRGQCIKTVINVFKPQGTHTVSLSGGDVNRSISNNNILLLRLSTKEKKVIKKVILF